MAFISPMKHKAKSSAECMGREEVVRSSAKGKVLANHLEWESKLIWEPSKDCQEQLNGHCVLWS